MKAIKIDVVKKTVTEVDIPCGDPVTVEGETGYRGRPVVEALAAVIGRGPITSALLLGQGDVLFVSEDALQLKPEDIPGWFIIDGKKEILAFNGVIVNETTNLTHPPKITADEVARRKVRFLGKLAAPVDIRASSHNEPTLMLCYWLGCPETVMSRPHMMVPPSGWHWVGGDDDSGQGRWVQGLYCPQHGEQIEEWIRRDL
jgi:hypothetical protein